MLKIHHTLIKTLIVIGISGLVSVSLQAQEKSLEAYSSEETLLVHSIMVYKQLCDVMVPDFKSETYYDFLKWEMKYQPLVAGVKKHKQYKASVSLIYDKPNAMPKGEELAGICANVVKQFKTTN